MAGYNQQGIVTSDALEGLTFNVVNVNPFKCSRKSTPSSVITAYINES